MEIWKKDSTCCVRIINHRGREVCPYPQKAKRGDSASDNSEDAARELLPESIIENKNLATLGLILGFVLMMILDVALG